jgi:hypothetical protein
MTDDLTKSEKAWLNSEWCIEHLKPKEKDYDEANWAIEQALASGANIHELEVTGMNILKARNNLLWTRSSSRREEKKKNEPL